MRAILALGAVALATLMSTPILAKPNIVVIMADDLDDYNLQYNPSIMALANQGIRFVNSFTDQALCSPSRASFLTGQTSHNTGVDDNHRSWQKFLPHVNDQLGPWLQAAGYTTGFIGKTLSNYDKDATLLPGWDTWIAFKAPRYFDYKLNVNGRLVAFGRSDTDYSTDVLSRKAVNFIHNQTNPFFLWVAPKAPHREHVRDYPVPPPRYRGRFDSQSFPRISNFNEYDVADKPGLIRDLPPFNSYRIARIQTDYRRRLETTLGLDDLVGDVVAELTAGGKLSNTIVVFTSDDGWSLGSHRWEGKELIYEEADRVPLILTGPGIPANETRSQLVNNIDLLATILDVAGASASTPIDGKSLVPVINNASVAWRTALLLEGTIKWAGLSFVAVRTAQTVYAEYDSLQWGHEVELYDLAGDPFEKKSRSGGVNRARRDALKSFLISSEPA